VTLREAARRLAPDVAGRRLSPLFRTSPVGGPPQPDFINAVLVGRTRLAAAALLARLKELERAAGRRAGRRHAPRPLDLDLLIYGTVQVSSRRLTLPHPLISERLFVLEPLVLLTPRRVVPGTGRTVTTLLREARERSSETVRRLGAGSRVSGRARRARAARRGAATPRG
jgi:2-amino-4-hydroxy-6-hydroxymethyldihydropteridine diphosphokinase